MPKTFKHSGDLGDIIFALPAVRALGGGVLYLDPDGGFSNPLTKIADKVRTKLTAAAIDSFTPMLLQQPYISEVRHWHGEAVDYDLDEFRRHLRFNNLSDSHLAAFGLPLTERDTPWLEIREPIVIEGRPIVMNRSVRYQGNHVFWEMTLPRIKPSAVFVGYQKEHEIFQYTFGHEVMYYPTPDILTLARVIAGCQKFLGNSSFPHALAEGMKKDLVCEVFRVAPNTIFKRSGAQYA
ncbi:MAG TPA: hypothetical protein VGG44_01935 [Tepidisphaeraceae bacterium]|jgi:hypothetical protein